MNLVVDTIQKPSKASIGNPVEIRPAEVRPEHAHLDPEIQRNFVEIEEILRKHAKVALWDQSGEQVLIQCNFSHVFLASAKTIMNLNVRCPECRAHAAEIIQEIYAKKQVDPALFEIRRINKFGQLSLRCVKREHKLQIPFGASIKHTPPDFCPECIVDGGDDKSPFVDMDLAGKLQALNTESFEFDFPDTNDSDPEFGSYAMRATQYGSDYSNPDFDLISDIDLEDMSPQHSRQNSPQHSPHSHDRCCSDVDAEFEDYFDKSDPEDPYQSLEYLFVQHADEYEAGKARAQAPVI